LHVKIDDMKRNNATVSPLRTLRTYLSRRLNTEVTEPEVPVTSGSGAQAAAVEDLIAVETEYDKYTRTLQTLVWGSVIVIGSLCLIVALPLWMNGGEPAVPLLWDHVDGDDALAAFGILAAIILALQVITRTPPTQQPDREFEARKKVMSLLAIFLVVISLGLGGYLAVQNMIAATTGVFDPVRTFGPAVGGAILAVLAADAASADSRRSSPQDRAAQNARYAMRLREQVKSLHAGIGRAPTRIERAIDIAMLVTVPAVILLVLDLRTPPEDVAQGLVSAFVLCGYCAAVYGVVYDTFVAATRGTWSFVEASFVMSVIVFVVLALSLFIAITETSTEENWAARSAGGLLGFFVVTAGPAAVAWFLIRAGGHDSRRGLLRDIAFTRATAQLRAAEDRVTKTPTIAPWNKVAIAGFVVSGLFPFGAILGTVARRQIAVSSKGGSPQRGSRLAAAAIVISCCVPVLLIAGLVVVMIVNPSIA
jgi:hypothetical protein